jgi:SAM-dependent methyltransferase
MAGTEFDKYAEEYEDILNASLGASGEGPEFFARYKAQYVARLLSPEFAGKVLDFGCGIGLLAGFLKQVLPRAMVHGYDPSQASIEQVEPRLAAEGRFAADFSSLDTDYDAVIIANVLHHIGPGGRLQAMNRVVARMKDGGRLIVIEHNPINPFTRHVVATCAFDKGVVLLPRRETLQLVRDARLTVEKADFIVFFPRVLAIFRFLEPALARCPLGAQYAVVGVKNGKP